MIDKQYGYDRTTKPWGQLTKGDYVIDRSVNLWRVERVNENGTIEVRGGERDETALWKAQHRLREVPVAILHPVDPVAMMRDMMGATPMAWKRHDDDTWTAAPWPKELPGNHPIDDYAAHLREWHGLRPQPQTSYGDLATMHAQHHTPGITHPVKHVHHEGSLGG